MQCSPPRRETMNLPENSNSVSRHRNDGRLVHNVLMETVYGIRFRCLRGWNVESHLHQTDGALVVLVEFQCHLVLARRALRHDVQRNFEARLIFHVETQQGTAELRRTPVPAPERQLLLQHLLFVVFLKVRGDLFLITVLESAESVKCAVLHENPDAVRVQHTLEVDKVHLGGGYLLHFARFVVLKHNVLVGHFKPALCLEWKSI